MKRILTVALTALTLAACATATPYQPALGSSGRGYSEQQIETNRWAVTFSGNSVTSRDTVEMYLLYRAAELTLQQGFDYFTVVNRATERDTRYVGSPDPFYGSYWGPYWSPYWRWYRGGLWSPWGPAWPDYDVREVSRYEATAEIVMHRGAKPADDPYAFDARQVSTNLRPKIILPQPKP